MPKREIPKMEDIENLMKLRCYIMCYYPSDIRFRDPIDALKSEIRNDLLKDFLDAKVITKEIFEKLTRK